MTPPDETAPASFKAGTIRAELQAQALRLGFCAVGIAAPVLPHTESERHEQWLRCGYGDGMSYLARNHAQRYDACSLLSECRSVIVTAHSIHYGAGGPEPFANENGGFPGVQVARYARGDDYHDVIKGKLEHLALWLAGETGGQRWKTTVDTSPLSEKALAVAAGIGWRGKHSLVVNAQLGSYFMLGCLLTTLELEPDQPVPDQCGTCRRCIDACPSGALVEAGVLNAARCITFHTTVRQGNPANASTLDGWLFGCDACQQACPYNAAPEPTTEPRLRPRAGLEGLTPEAVLRMSPAEFNLHFKGTSIAHYGLERLKVTAEVLLRERAALQEKTGAGETG